MAENVYSTGARITGLGRALVSHTAYAVAVCIYLFISVYHDQLLLSTRLLCLNKRNLFKIGSFSMFTFFSIPFRCFVLFRRMRENYRHHPKCNAYVVAVCIYLFISVYHYQLLFSTRLWCLNKRNLFKIGSFLMFSFCSIPFRCFVLFRRLSTPVDNER